ncbi:uncharacterized protein JCM6883_004026 [Sporobolomyces salmoneus]|uniref:uncharacterized protein n=1 Tax=Sporobolomyces salmoneus TaxID=183962 RepID=UPI00316D55B6
MRRLHVVNGGDPSDDALEALMAVSVSLSSSTNSIFAYGAGVSTNAGIPDFRSSSSGIYATTSSSSSTRSTGSTNCSIKDLFSYSSLIKPETRASHLEFMANLHQQTSTVAPTPRGSPTVFHDFLRRVDEMEKLLRAYSQNVDGFEGDAGLGYVNFDNFAEDGKGKGSSSGRGSINDAGDDSASDYDDSSSRKGPPLKRRKRSSTCSISCDVESTRWTKIPRSQKVVAMHGSLRSVVCSACGWKGEWDSRISRKFGKGRRIDCPRCEERSNLRLSASKRPLPPSSLSFLRPNLLLYDDPSSTHSSHLAALSSLSAHDLSSNPDFLLVAGTSLQIPGFKQLVKDFAREVKANGGVRVLVNREAVAASWDEVFDFEFRMDADAFARTILSNLEALLPSPRTAAFAPSMSSTSLSSTSTSVTDPRQTPSPPRPSPFLIPTIPSQLPTPSPTPSLASHLALKSSPSFFAPSNWAPPTSTSTSTSVPSPPCIVAKSCPLVEESHLPSPPPTSSPIRSRSNTQLQTRPLKIFAATDDFSCLVSSSGDVPGAFDFDAEAEEEEEKEEEEEEKPILEERIYTVKESRSLVEELMRQAHEIWKEGEARRQW